MKLLDFDEDIYATVTVEERKGVRGRWRQLSMNGVNVAGTSSELLVIQKMQGHLPLLLHPHPRNVLHIGFGSGGTAWAVSRYPVEKIDIAEISKDVIRRASKYFREINHGVLEDPRVKISFTDGRNKVLASTEMIIKSFYRVFPYTSIWYINSTFNDYVIVIGKLDGPSIDFPVMESKLRIPEVAADLEEIACASPYKILDFFFFANREVGEFVGDVPLHTDDNMAVEYLSGKALSKRNTGNENYRALLEHRTSVKKYLAHIDRAAADSRDIIALIDKYERASRYNLIGQLLFRQGRRRAAFDTFDRILVTNADDLEPVEYFGSSFQEPFLRKARPR